MTREELENKLNEVLAFEKQERMTKKDTFSRGEYIYLGMVHQGDKVSNLSVGYTPSYALKKMKENLENLHCYLEYDASFYIHKVRVGELHAFQKFRVHPDIDYNF